MNICVYSSSKSPFVKRMKRSCRIFPLSSSADQRSPFTGHKNASINFISWAAGTKKCVYWLILTGALLFAATPVWVTNGWNCGVRSGKKIYQIIELHCLFKICLHFQVIDSWWNLWLLVCVCMYLCDNILKTIVCTQIKKYSPEHTLSHSCCTVIA